MKATTELKNEHQWIEIMLRVLKAIAERFEIGEQVSDKHLDGIL